MINSRFLDGMTIERSEGRSRQAAGERDARQPAGGAAPGQLPPARLGHFAPALLGLPDPDHPLRELRRRAGAGEGSAGEAAGGRHLRPAGQSARPPSDLEECRVPEMRRRGAARDRHDGHVRRFVLVFRALHRSVERRARRPTPKIVDDWLPVDQYIGGIEHAILHLLYSRFFTARDEEDRPCRPRRAVRRPVHAGHGGARDLSQARRRLGRCRPTSRSKASATRAAPRSTATGEPIEIGPIEKMSKSKKNTVDPDDIIGTYGADTARWFVLSDSPPERDVIWTEEGVQGAWRFVQRLWRLIGEIAEIAKAPAARPADIRRAALAVRKAAHRALAKVSDDIEQAALQPLRRAYLRIRQCARRGAIGEAETAPAPRFRLGDARGRRHPGAAVPPDDAASGRGMLGGARPRDPGRRPQAWPEVEPDLLVENTITLPVQVNGKKRADVTVPRDAEKCRYRGCRVGARCGKKGAGRQGARKRSLSSRKGSSMSWPEEPASFGRVPAARLALRLRRADRRLLPAALRRPDRRSAAPVVGDKLSARRGRADRRRRTAPGSRRVGVEVRNELMFGLTGGGRRVAADYQLKIKLTSTQPAGDRRHHHRASGHAKSTASTRPTR